MAAGLLFDPYPCLFGSPQAVMNHYFYLAAFAFPAFHRKMSRLQIFPTLQPGSQWDALPCQALEAIVKTALGTITCQLAIGLCSDLNSQRAQSLNNFINEPLWLEGGRGQEFHQRSLCAFSNSEDSSCFRQA